LSGILNGGKNLSVCLAGIYKYLLGDVVEAARREDAPIEVARCCKY
jgi:hypothetical protein